jgi:hypothetical protein
MLAASGAELRKFLYLMVESTPQNKHPPFSSQYTIRYGKLSIKTLTANLFLKTAPWFRVRAVTKVSQMRHSCNRFTRSCVPKLKKRG